MTQPEETGAEVVQLKSPRQLRAQINREMRLDGWANALTGVGIDGVDWRKRLHIETQALLPRNELDDLYQDDALAAKIVDMIPEHATRRWIEITGGEGKEAADFQKAVLDALEELDAQNVFTEAMKLDRKDGGCLILIGADDGKPLIEPLEPENVRNMRNLHVIEKWLVLPDTIDLDPESPTFDQPFLYKLLPRPLLGSILSPTVDQLRENRRTIAAAEPIHPSRLFVFHGRKISEIRMIANRGFGASSLQAAHDSIKNYRSLWDSISSKFKDLSQLIFKMRGAGDLIAGDKDGIVQKRAQMAASMRSTLRMMVIDAEDALEELGPQWAGVADLLREAKEDVALAAEMPLTMLFGHAPGGLSTDDESGTRNFQDTVMVKQDRLLRPKLLRLIKMVIAWKKIKEPDGWKLGFKPLSEPTEAQRGDTRQKEAMTADTYVKMGAIEAEEVRGGIRNDPLSPYTLMDDAEWQSMKDARDEAELQAMQPPQQAKEPLEGVDQTNDRGTKRLTGPQKPPKTTPPKREGA